MKRTAWFSRAMVAMLLLGSALSVSAQDWRNDRYGRHYRYSEREVRQIGRRNGYELGLREGQRDYRQGFRFDYKHNRAYKDGKIGYRDEYHHDGNYKDGFREGFEAGYREGYNGRRGDYRRDWPRDDGRYYPRY